MKKSFYLLCITFGLLFPTVVLGDSSFRDISPDFWAFDEIRYLHDSEIIRGHDNGTFAPHEPITRAQAALMLMRALHVDLVSSKKPHFSDVGVDHYAYDAIQTAYKEGIILGSNGSYMPDAPLTRGQMAAIIDRAFTLDEATTDTNFKDVTRLHLFYSNIQNLAHNQITTGYPDRSFRPEVTTTRAEFSVFLARALEDSFKPEPPNIPDLETFKEKIIEGEQLVEQAMYKEWESSFYSNQPMSEFKQLTPLFQKYYTNDLIDTKWKTFYRNELNSWGPELAQAFHFQYLENLKMHVLGPNYVVITGTEPATELNHQEGYFEYSLVYMNGMWLIDDISGNY